MNVSPHILECATSMSVTATTSLQGMQRFYKMWLEQLQLFIDTLGPPGPSDKAGRAPGKRQQLSLQADSAGSSQFVQHEKHSQNKTQGITSLPVMLLLLGLFLWLLYNKVMPIGKQSLLPHVSGALSTGLRFLPPMLPPPSVVGVAPVVHVIPVVDVANQTVILL